MAKKKAKAARKTNRGLPTKYHSGLCDLLLDCMREGKALTDFSAEQDIPYDTLKEWARENEEFAYAYKRGKILQLYWWNQLGRAALLSPGKIDRAIYIFNMKVKFREFGYHESSGAPQGGGGPVFNGFEFVDAETEI